MKRLALLMIFLMVTPVAFALEQDIAVGDTATKGANPVASSFRYEPAPVAPGTEVEIWLTIENRGEATAENVEVRIFPDYPFTAIGSGTKTVGTLAAFQRSQVKFEVRVDERAVTGSNELDFEITRSGSSQKTPVRVTLDVRPLDYLVSLEDVRVVPSPSPQGSELAITVDLQNRGSTLVRSVTAELDLPETTLVPVGESNRQVVDFIDGGQTRQVSYRVLVAPEADSGPVRVPLILTFFDVDGNLINQSQNIGVVVGSQPRLSVIVESSTITRDALVGDLVVKFVNRGTEDIKFMNANLESTEAVTLLSNDEIYIGEVDSDDFETIDVKVRVNDLDDGKFMVPIVVEYADANNKLYNQDFTVNVPVFSKDELGTAGGGGAVWFIVLLIVVGGGYYLYRRRKRKK